MKIVDYVKAFINPQKIGSAETIIADIKQEAYIKELALYTAISYIASSISKCNIKTYVNNKEVEELEYFTLNYSPNFNQNSSQFWHQVVEKMFYTGEALVIPMNNKLYVADSYSVEEYPIKGNKYLGVTIKTLAINRTFNANEIFLFRLDNVEVKSLVDGLYSTYGQLLAYAIKSYKKSNGIKYKLKISNSKAGDPKFNSQYEEVVEKQLKKFMENDTAIYPEFEGYDLEDISPKSNVKDSSDVRNIKKEIFETVAQAIKIPQSLMLGNITNMNDVVKAFITFGVEPITDMIGEELSRKQGYERWKEGRYCKVDTSTINHIDILDVAEKVDKLIASGTLCVDEIRDILGKEALNTTFSTTHFITKNYETAENSLKGGENN